MLRCSFKWIKIHFLAIGTLGVGVLLGIYAWQLSVPVISDETVTMANAAWITGRDWSLMIAALGGLYYRFAQAFMTIPFLEWLDDPSIIYSFSIIMQTVLQTSTIPVVYIICRRYLNVKSEIIATLIGMGVCLIPSLVLYTFYYRGDYLLGILPWYILVLYLEIIKSVEDGNKVRQRVYTIIITGVSVFAYMAHTRGIVLVIAITITSIVIKVFWKKNSLNWPLAFATFFFLLMIDLMISSILKEALYSVSGLNSNTFESTDVGYYLNVFSLWALKDVGILCVSWLYTLITTTQGLVLIGLVVIMFTLIKLVVARKERDFDTEKVCFLFALLVFLGYYAVGALYFKGTYYALRIGELDRRVDRLLYDRYAICGAGMVVFVALYVICCRKEWFKWKEKLSSIFIYAGVIILFFWKILPVVVKYKGYIYNTITLNTFNIVNDPANILSGEYYSKKGLIAVTILGIVLMSALLVISSSKRKWMPYMILALVIVSDIVIIHVNYKKIRKASNDYVIEATEEVVCFMQGFEDDIVEEFPYILKGGLSGVKIQFYQSQLIDYRMFGKKQEEQLNIDDYFIISKHDDIDLTWYEDDYYLFEAFDYENAQYDIVYVKGERLMQRMEQLGYSMIKYESSDGEIEYE